MENYKDLVGKLMVRKDLDENGKVRSLTLYVLDSPEEEGYYVQLAIVEDFDDGTEVYTGTEAGGGFSKPYNPATDEDILLVLKKIDKGVSSPHQKVEEWVENLKTSEDTSGVVLPIEISRIENLAKQIN